MIRSLYWDAVRGDRNLKMAGSESLQEQVNHINHCFDYLRQGIMCAGDMSIEGAASDGLNAVDGFDQLHTCKSWVIMLLSLRVINVLMGTGGFTSMDGWKCSTRYNSTATGHGDSSHLAKHWKIKSKCDTIASDMGFLDSSLNILFASIHLDLIVLSHVLPLFPPLLFLSLIHNFD